MCINLRKNKKLKYKEFMYLSITKILSINVLIIPLFFASYRFGCFYMIAVSYLTAFFHELFHIIAMKLMRCPVKKIIIEPFGITALMNEAAVFNSYKELFICLFGPFFNLTAIVLIKLLENKIYIPESVFLIKLNLSMLIFNLIPTLPLDGGRFLKAVLSVNFGVIKSYNMMLKLSKYINFTILILAGFSLIISPFNFSLILISVFLLSNLCSEYNIINKIILKDILNSKASAKNTINTKNKVITMSYNTPARLILKKLSFDYFLDVFVVNENGKVLFSTTETEIINLLVENGITSKLSDIKILH